MVAMVKVKGQVLHLLRLQGKVAGDWEGLVGKDVGQGVRRRATSLNESSGEYG